MGVTTVAFDTRNRYLKICTVTAREGNHSSVVRRVKGMIATAATTGTDLMRDIKMGKTYIKKLFVG